MPREAVQDNVGTKPLDPPEVKRLEDQGLQLSQQINALTSEYHAPIEDLELAQEMAQAVKPYIDRLTALHRLLNPVDRIVDKTDQIHELQSEIVADVAEVEDIADDIGAEVDEGTINDLQGEIQLAPLSIETQDHP